MNSILKAYFALLGEAAALFTQAAAMYTEYRNNPPNDPAEFTAALERIRDLKTQGSKLLEDARSLLSSKPLTAEDIAEFRAQDAETYANNQAMWDDPKPTLIDTAPPILPTPVPGPLPPVEPTPPTPTEPPPVVPPVGVSYGTAYPYPIPSNEGLKARGYVVGDRCERRASGDKWRVVNVVEGGNVWKLEYIIT